MNAVQRPCFLLLLGVPILSFAQQSPPTAGLTVEQHPSTPPVGKTVALSPRPASTPEEREGRIKLDVVVTDDSGAPVSGLDLNDLRLRENSDPSLFLSFHPVLAMDAAAKKAAPPVEVILLIDAMNVP